jgi:hypothetical protein
MEIPGSPKKPDAFLISSACAVIAALFALGVADSFSEIFCIFAALALAAVFSLWFLAHIGGIPFWRASATAGDYIHLLVYYPLYRAQIKAAGEGKLASFYWGGTGFVGTMQSDRTLVYDASGELARSVGSEKTEFGKKEIRRLIGNFYLVVDWTT